MQCLKCGSENSATAKFCRGCGNKLEGIEPVSTDSLIQCSNCGHANASGTKFCPKCGAPVVVGAPIPTASVPANSPAVPLPNHAAVALTPVKRGYNKMVVGIAIAVVLVGAVGGGVYLTSSSSKSTPTTAQAEPSLLQKLKCLVSPHENEFKAIVTADEARFIFPVGKKDRWEWNVMEGGTPNQGKLDYVWQVQIAGGWQKENGIILGFYHESKGQPQRGDFSTLIASGQVAGVRANKVPIPGGPHYATNITGLTGVSVQLICESVVIFVNGKENVQNVVLSQPEQVRFRAEQPGTAPRGEDVSVTYKN